jgi:hypothetical protein
MDDPSIDADLSAESAAEARRARRRRASRARRRKLRARRLGAATVLTLLTGSAVFAWGRSSPISKTPAIARLHTHAAPVLRAPALARRASPVRRAPAARVASAAVPSPGSLPQTHAFPSARTPAFRLLMERLWAGVVRDSVRPALPAFFPKGAFVQLKAISGAASDWEYRLVRDYALDIEAAHRLLGSAAAQATLLRVDVRAGYGHWVPPGVCYNSIGYYEMPGARIVYRERGETRSFGVASMVSWRGQWYVVHLGAVLRAGETGVVDEPMSGAGSPVYSGTC